MENSNQPNYWTQPQLKNIQKQVKVCNVHLREMEFITIYTAESNIFPPNPTFVHGEILFISYFIFCLSLFSKFSIYTQIYFQYIYLFYSMKRHFKYLPSQINTGLIFLPLWLSSENHEKIMVRMPSLKFIRFPFQFQNQGVPW